MTKVKTAAWLIGTFIVVYSAFCTALVSYVGIDPIISIHLEIGRAHVRTPVTRGSRMPSSA